MKPAAIPSAPRAALSRLPSDATGPAGPTTQLPTSTTPGPLLSAADAALAASDAAVAPSGPPPKPPLPVSSPSYEPTGASRIAVGKRGKNQRPRMGAQYASRPRRGAP